MHSFGHFFLQIVRFITIIIINRQKNTIYTNTQKNRAMQILFNVSLNLYWF